MYAMPNMKRSGVRQRQTRQQSPKATRSDVDNSTRQPVQAYVTYASSGPDQPYVVPSNKRLVVEYVSGSVGCQKGLLAGIRLETTVADVFVSHRVLWGAPQEGGESVYYPFAQMVQLYADPGTTVRLGFNGSGSFTGKAAISGYLVDARPLVTVRRTK